MLEDAIYNGKYDSEIESYYMKPIGQQDAPDSREAKEITWASGCTAVSCIVTPKQVIVANCGDSRAVLCKEEGGEVKEEQLSTDHKPNLPDEKKRIKAAEGTVESNRVNGFLSTSRSLGIFRFKSNYDIPIDSQLVTGIPEIKVIDRSSTMKFLILSSDGIWDCVSNQDGVEFLDEGIKLDPKQNLSALLAEMQDELLAREVDEQGGPGSDNMSAILVQF
jgi:serine/threonine protein phosphatase PrpC